jgi:glycine hydroxymethyltransferase
LTNKNISGKEAEKALGVAGITVNKNTVPFDPRSPYDPSGIRLGTPALTTRGMKEQEMVQVAEWIEESINHAGDENYLKQLHIKITKFTKDYPLPN